MSEEDQENQFSFDIERIEDFRFRIDFDKKSMGQMITDETEEIGGAEKGPNPSRLLAASTLNCLMASLTFCLNKKRVAIKSLKGTVTGTIKRVDGRLRITNIDVDIVPKVAEEDEEKVKKCEEIFENYCVVTQSVRNGIDVDVNVEV